MTDRRLLFQVRITAVLFRDYASISNNDYAYTEEVAISKGYSNDDTVH